MLNSLMVVGNIKVFKILENTIQDIHKNINIFFKLDKILQVCLIL